MLKLNAGKHPLIVRRHVTRSVESLRHRTVRIQRIQMHVNLRFPEWDWSRERRNIADCDPGYILSEIAVRLIADRTVAE